MSVSSSRHTVKYGLFNELSYDYTIPVVYWYTVMDLLWNSLQWTISSQIGVQINETKYRAGLCKTYIYTGALLRQSRINGYVCFIVLDIRRWSRLYTQYMYVNMCIRTCIYCLWSTSWYAKSIAHKTTVVNFIGIKQHLTLQQYHPEAPFTYMN